MPRARSTGFTLIEVMVALVIVAFGMMAVHTMLNSYAAASVYVEQKTLASWIATNKLTELSIGPTWPSLGDSDEDLEFAGRQWRCEIEVSETAVANLRRVDVSVRLLRRSRARRAQGLGAHRAPCPGRISAAAVVGAARRRRWRRRPRRRRRRWWRSRWQR